MSATAEMKRDAPCLALRGGEGNHVSAAWGLLAFVTQRSLDCRDNKNRTDWFALPLHLSLAHLSLSEVSDCLYRAAPAVELTF